MSQFDLQGAIDEFGERYVMTFVETIFLLDNTVSVDSIDYPNKSEYQNLNFHNPADATNFPESLLVQKRLEFTKDKWVTQLMLECNALQEAALALHTITKVKPLHQKSMYDLKYEASMSYVTEVDAWLLANSKTPPDLPTSAQVAVPDMIGNEAAETGDPVYYLALAVIQNYNESQTSLQKYYGTIEGMRRVKKQEIVACTTIAQMEALSWITWPTYEGNPPAPQD